MSLVRVARLGYRVAYQLLRAYSRLARPHTRGVKVLIAHGERVLLVRHAYGRGEWDLPGGFCRRGEAFADAARREIAEELGVQGARWTDVGELRRRFDGRHETLHGFRAELPSPDVRIVAPAEVAELGWFAPPVLPEPLAPIVRRVIALSARGLPDSGRG